MIENIINKLKNKSIVILGFGKEGRSTYNFIRRHMGNIKLVVADKNDLSNDTLIKNDDNIELICGDNYLENLDKFDLIIKSPGISLNYLDSDYLDKIKNKITSQLELLLEVNKNNIIGITGTKGKSTTSSLLYNIIKNQGRDVILAGNIGIPVLDEIENYKDDTLIVVEMSSHQLEFVKTSPRYAIVLNMFQDHLDHARTLEHYHQNKMNIFRFQDKNDYAFYASDNPYTITNINKLINNNELNGTVVDIRFDNSNKLSEYSVRYDNGSIYMNGEIVYNDKNRILIGDHNLKNIMFVVAISKVLGLDLEEAQKTICEFRPLEFRMEDLGIHNNIHFYVDTIATIPEATINATKSLENIDTLIFGGENRNTDYTEFIDYLIHSNINNFICMYDTGFLIKPYLEKTNKKVYFTRNMREAYEIALKCTKPGAICILSPAASSKDVFKDFEEKGKLFKALVNGEESKIVEHPKN